MESSGWIEKAIAFERIGGEDNGPDRHTSNGQC
jgi:hypothetical protein